MSRLSKKQIEEISKCAVDFPYFCEHYVKINDIPFVLHPYQVLLYDHIEDNHFSIFSKFRQGGFTTEIAIYCLWRCLFRLDQKVMWLSSDVNSQGVCNSIVKRTIEQLPNWMSGNVMKMTNSFQKSFPDTNSSMYFCKPEDCRGHSINLLIIDEASYLKDMDKHWRALFPCVVSGRAIVFSTPNYDDDWFWRTKLEADKKLNSFSAYNCNYKEHPEFCDPQWEKDTKINIGQKGWDIEYEQKPMNRVQIESASKKSFKKQWRSIWDEWDSSSNLAEEGLEWE